LTLTPESESDREGAGAAWSDCFVFLMLSALNAGSSSRAVFFAAAGDPLSALELLDLDFTLTPFAAASVAQIATLAIASAATRCLMAMASSGRGAGYAGVMGFVPAPGARAQAAPRAEAAIVPGRRRHGCRNVR
jgi:hypothetical protein